MKSCIVTGWSGTEFARIACYTLPLIETYALKHGHAFSCSNLGSPLRHPSWMKVPVLQHLLRCYETVVWIDADVVVVNGEFDIASQVPPTAWQGLVEHDTECGAVPNCGVWVLRRPMLDVLDEAWASNTHLDHCWWEQAAILERMGYVLNGCQALPGHRTLLYENTFFLDTCWNDHPLDVNRAEKPHFVHCTQYGNRLAQVRASASASNLAV